jgi:hypothetical protein
VGGVKDRLVFKGRGEDFSDEAECCVDSVDTVGGGLESAIRARSVSSQHPRHGCNSSVFPFELDPKVKGDPSTQKLLLLRVVGSQIVERNEALPSPDADLGMKAGK